MACWNATKSASGALGAVGALAYAFGTGSDEPAPIEVPAIAAAAYDDAPVAAAPAAAPAPAAAATGIDGQAVYNKACAACHAMHARTLHSRPAHVDCTKAASQEPL